MSELELILLQKIADSLSVISELLTKQLSSPQQAAPTAQASIPADTMILNATVLTVAYDETGKAIYRMKGDQFLRFGVRVWDEVLPLLGIDPSLLQPGPNPINMRVSVKLKDGKPKKVIGLYL